MRDTDGIDVSRTGEVSIARFARPTNQTGPTRSLLEALPTILRREVETSAGAIVLADFEDVFGASVDVGEPTEKSADDGLDHMVRQVVATIAALPIPVVSAIEGPCSGAAVDIALACDLRIGAQGCSFVFPSAQLGALSRAHRVHALTNELGRQTASRLLVFGDRIAADEAAWAGLLARVVPEGEAVASAVELAASAAAAPREVVALTKELVRRAADGQLELREFESRRRELLDSESRRDAVERAQRRMKIDPAGAGRG
jgi:enoyl-CoA hydratase/carnithine racemase